MKRLKQAAAAIVAAAVIAGSMSGCSSTDYAMTANGTKINAGVYINYILNEMTNQMYMFYYSGEITDMSECFDQEIDGKDFKTYVKDTAMENTKEFAAINAKFDELGLELSDDDNDSVADSVSSTWESMGDFYESEGISKESLKQCYEVSYKRSAIFDYYYAEGGIEEVSDDDLQEYVNSNYLRYKSITVAKSTNEDEDAAAEENEEIQALVDQYLAEAESLDFAGFDTIIDEYSAYQEAQEAAEDEDSEDGTEDEEAEEAEEAVEEAAEDAEEAVTELDSEADESASDSAAEDESEAEEDTSDETDTDESEADTDEESEEDDEAEEEEEDPYANETVMMYTDYLDSDSDSYDEDYAARIQAFKDADYGTPTVYEDDSYYYLFVTADVAERTDYVEDNRDTLLQGLKGDDFDALVEDWVKAIDISLNDKAIKRYTVQEVYDRQNEYYSS